MAAHQPPRPTAENILTLVGGVLFGITAVYIAAHSIPLVIIAAAAAVVVITALILITHR